MRVHAFIIVWLLSGAASADQDALNKQLYDAVLFNDPAAITAALAAGADVNHKVNRRSLLGWAAQNGNVEVVEALLLGGADPDAVDDIGHTPMMRAIETRQLEVVRRLLQAGPDLDRRDTYGRLLVNLAVEADNTEIVEALLEAGADFNVVDADGNSPALLAVLGEGEAMYGILAALGRHGGNLNLGSRVYTPLYYAVEQNNVELARALLEAGADPSVAPEDGGLPLISGLADDEMRGLLLAAGADPNGVDGNGNPVLFEALFAVSEQAAEDLIAAGADVNKPGADGRPALAYARDMGSQDAVELLKRHGAADGEDPATSVAAVPVPAPAAAPGGSMPRVPDLPRYGGTEPVYEDDVTAIYATDDPVPEVAQATMKLLQDAGWQGEVTTQHEGNWYLTFTRGSFQLNANVAIAPAMNNRTTIQYFIKAR